MAHFAKLDENNVVVQVIVVADACCLDESGNESELVGAEFCRKLFGGRWLKTSYNTYANMHLQGKTPFRKNYAGIGFTYDEQLDAFIRPKQDETDVFDAEHCVWVSINPVVAEIGVTRV
jgi:hypothetical protein